MVSWLKENFFTAAVCGAAGMLSHYSTYKDSELYMWLFFVVAAVFLVRTFLPRYKMTITAEKAVFKRKTIVFAEAEDLKLEYRKYIFYTKKRSRVEFSVKDFDEKDRKAIDTLLMEAMGRVAATWTDEELESKGKPVDNSGFEFSVVEKYHPILSIFFIIMLVMTVFELIFVVIMLFAAGLEEFGQSVLWWALLLCPAATFVLYLFGKLLPKKTFAFKDGYFSLYSNRALKCRFMPQDVCNIIIADNNMGLNFQMHPDVNVGRKKVNLQLLGFGKRGRKEIMTNVKAIFYFPE